MQKVENVIVEAEAETLIKMYSMYIYIYKQSLTLARSALVNYTVVSNRCRQ